MTASDPAVAAAMRAWLSDDDAGEVAVLAAREALAPLRQVIDRFDALPLSAPEYASYSARDVDLLVDELRALIYPEGEL